MANERNIGKIVSVDSLSVFVRLDDDLKSLYKSGYEEIYPVARINSYIIIPVGADRIVAMVNRVMSRDETDLSKNSAAIFLTEASRYLSATMVGTIDGSRYIQGVYNYPILDNPVWYVTRDDLNIIFDQTEVRHKIDYKNDFYLPVGSSPVFPDFKVKINPDKLFAKHAAILGNTGSGKSCTLASVLQSIFSFSYSGEQKLKNAHIVIFDTNGEYKEAFHIDDAHKVNPFCINDEGLKVPYWFMNYDDMDYLFEPTSGTQAPILKRALALAKSQAAAKQRGYIPNIYINKLYNFLSSIEKQDWTSNQTIYYESESVAQCFTQLKDNKLVDFDLSALCSALSIISNEKSKLSQSGRFINGNTDTKTLNDAIDIINQELEKYKLSVINVISSDNRNIDLPLYFNFENMTAVCFDMAVKESSSSQDKLNEYISTLKLRMQSFVDDIRLASPLMFDQRQDIQGVLVQFLAFILGDYTKVYNKDIEDSPYNNYWRNTIEDGDNDEKGRDCKNQVTIIDMSLLPFQVLETITGLIGRIILEFMSRFEKDKRGAMPVVLVLEEAQNYIPEINRKDRESISRKVFERIAREGRKYGLALVVSSQRPSELSKTVLSQCNSFIVHRIQNPDDQVYIRRLVSSANSEILNQLPTLPQQHAIIMGDCVRTPVVARIDTANPTPNSNNPEFISKWIKNEEIDYGTVVDKWLENEDTEAAVSEDVSGQ